MRMTVRPVRWSIVAMLASEGLGIGLKGQEPPKLMQQVVIHAIGDTGPSRCDKWMRQTSDRSQPAKLRIEALDSLSKECLDHRTFQSLGSIIESESDDVTVRSAIVRVLPRWGDSPMHRIAILRALSLPGVRPAAVDTLDKMGQARGDKESRLLAELKALRSGVADPYRVSALPVVYGRDRRVLDYLDELFRRGNRWERALATSELFGIGEVETALAAVRDPESRVRNSLAVAIGWYRDQRGLQVLRQLAGDSDSGVANRAKSSLLRLGVAPTTPPPTNEVRWAELLKELSEFRLSDPRVASGASERKIRERWLGEPAATEQEIEALERRLGQHLPPSYRSFLAVSNGFTQQSSFIHRLYGANEVDWFGARNKGWADAYRQTYPNLPLCLQISDVGDSAVVLLNPKTVSSDGEWQTYFFANWMAGARPYGSFREFMEEELNGRCEWRNR
jgi:HEAT repeat protein